MDISSTERSETTYRILSILKLHPKTKSPTFLLRNGVCYSSIDVPS